MGILDGKKVKKEILEEVKALLQSLDKRLGLAVIQIGEDPASQIYVRQKAKMADMLNYNFNHIKLDEQTTLEEVLGLIDKLNNDEAVHGILVQMPIPKHLDAKVIQNRIAPNKDVDGLTDLNSGKLVHNDDCLIPCTPLGMMALLDSYQIDVEGKLAVIVGRSSLVGRPMAELLLNRNATVVVCHSKTKNLKDLTKNADILVAAVGKKHFITEDMVKDGAVVLDVGINREDGILYGDVDFEAVKDKCSFITPVPGGVGQMTVAELGKNVYKAYLLQKK